MLAPRLAAGEEGEEGGGLQASRTGLTLGQDPNSSFGGSGTSLSESWGLQKEAPARPLSRQGFNLSGQMREKGESRIYLCMTSGKAIQKVYTIVMLK